MMRTSITKLARPALLSRTFATTTRAMSAGDTGAPPKTGGQGCVFLQTRIEAKIGVAREGWMEEGIAAYRDMTLLLETPTQPLRASPPSESSTTPLLKRTHRDQKLTLPPDSDAFQRRERASEDYAIRQREKEKLRELKKKLAEQQAHLQALSDHM
jgi:hypothetical protein